MRIFEIILKLAFLAGSIYSIVTETVSTPFLVVYLVVCLILGIVLIINKKSSYNYPQTKRDLMIRKIEGTLLIIFVAFIYIFQLK